MATLFELKAQLDADSNLEAVSSMAAPGTTASAVVYRNVDEFYTITDQEESHKQCWRNWDHVITTVGNEWASTQGWVIRTRTSADDLLTLQYVARILNVSEDTVRRWAKAGVVEAIALPSAGEYQSYRIRRAILNDLLQRKPSLAVKVS